MDEPELHMSSTDQAFFYEELYNFATHDGGNNQVIITTQQSVIVQDLVRTNIVRLIPGGPDGIEADYDKLRNIRDLKEEASAAMVLYDRFEQEILEKDPFAE